MESIKDKVAIIGMGCTKFGERWDAGLDDLDVWERPEARGEGAGIAAVGKHPRACVQVPPQHFRAMGHQAQGLVAVQKRHAAPPPKPGTQPPEHPQVVDHHRIQDDIFSIAHTEPKQQL